ncbi:hypothetical protein ACR0ST_09740 [Aliidiomarina sp. Khilg15.8]
MLGFSLVGFIAGGLEPFYRYHGRPSLPYQTSLAPTTFVLYYGVNNLITGMSATMRELPISIQRAMLRRHALAMLAILPLTVAAVGYLHWAFAIVSLIATLSIYSLTPAARRLMSIRKDKRINFSYVKSVEFFFNGALVIGLPLLAVLMFGLNWFFGLPVESLLYLLVAVNIAGALYFYLAQMPAVFSDRKVRVQFF